MKISVITVCRNAENTIEETIQSVVNQTFDDFEYIIIDGASTDKTLDIIKKYENKITKIVSEPDKGIYDAMNKGVERATGDYILFLNADDTLFHSNVLNLVSKHCDIEKYDMLYGDLIFLDKENGHFNNRKQGNISYTYICGGMLFHPTLFASKTLFEQCGKFDISYKIVADYDWILNALVKHKCSCKYLDFTTTIFNQGGISSDKKFKSMHKQERLSVQKKYFNSTQIFVYNFLYKTMRSFTNAPVIRDILSYSFKKSRRK